MFDNSPVQGMNSVDFCTKYFFIKSRDIYDSFNFKAYFPMVLYMGTNY